MRLVINLVKRDVTEVTQSLTENPSKLISMGSESKHVMRCRDA